MVKSVKPVLLIEVTTLRGVGTKDDPSRVVIQYWDYNNNLIFELDPTENN
ncbi:hypothetical protein [Streptococcus suis]|nr:hypothetical protein [Streptococcus suis]